MMQASLRTGDLAGRAAAVRTAIAGATLSLGEALLARVRDALSGSLRESFSLVLADGGQGATLASDSPYAAFQEYGFAGVEAVRESLRRQTTAFGRPMTPREVLVRAHARRVDAPAHGFLAESTAAMEGVMADGYAAAIAGALRS